MSEVVSPLVFQLGVGGVGGFIVGFALKKLSKLVPVLIGVFILALIYLSTRGIININYDVL
ncbi:MAG: FUN14 domain-containing protein [Candidatus Bathyarchaeia archaeon]